MQERRVYRREQALRRRFGLSRQIGRIRMSWVSIFVAYSKYRIENRGIVRVKKKKKKNCSQRCLVPVKNAFCSSNRSNRVLFVYHTCAYVFVRNSSSWLRYRATLNRIFRTLVPIYDIRPIWTRDAATRAPRPPYVHFVSTTTKAGLFVRANVQIFHS